AVAQGGWFLSNGDMNWNIRFQTDGPSIEHIYTYNLTEHWNKSGHLVLDGRPDIELEFRDQDLDGTPEYGIWRVISTTPTGDGAVRTWIWSNEGRHRPAQPG